MELIKFGSYENIKTKEIYVVLDFATNATNAQDGEQMVLYKYPPTQKSYVREVQEFKSKFRKFEV